jgi:hypothetical protein
MMRHTVRPRKEICEETPEPALQAGLPLPDPFPEYIQCPHCGELEVEVWCYQTRVQCHACGEWIAHTPPACFGTSEKCQARDP